MVEAFGLEPVILPDISGSLDGTVPERWIPTTYGGTSIEDIRTLGEARLTIAIGEHMRAPAARLHELTGVEYSLFRQLSGLKAVDRFVTLLGELSGRPAPASIRRRRAQLQDALLDGHFHFSGKRIAIAAEPDLLYALATCLRRHGRRDPRRGDDDERLEDPRTRPAARRSRSAISAISRRSPRAPTCWSPTATAARPPSGSAFRCCASAFPIFDRLGSQHKLRVGYQGARDLIFEVANIFESARHEPTPEVLDPVPTSGERA